MEYKSLVDEYYVYIDEAGDEGIGKLKQTDNRGQSRWLMLGAIIVTKENDRKLPSGEVKSSSNSRIYGDAIYISTS